MKINVSFSSEIDAAPSEISKQEKDCLFDNVMQLANYADNKGLQDVADILESALDVLLGQPQEPLSLTEDLRISKEPRFVRSRPTLRQRSSQTSDCKPFSVRDMKNFARAVRQHKRREQTTTAQAV